MIVQSRDDIRRKGSASFIVIEGINGGGKSTLIKGLSDWLSELGMRHLCSREPGGTVLGQQLRRLLLENSGQLCPESELFLFLADRAQHVRKAIIPALDAGETVICDRYTYSTVAFQGYGRGFDVDKLLQLNQLATNDLRPDLVILLDLPVEDALHRTHGRTAQGHGEADGFEQEELSFHHRVRQGFLEMASFLPEPVCILDAIQHKTALLAEARRWIERVL